MGFIEFLRSFNIWTVLIRLVLSALFGGIIGMERGRQRRAAGMRTHILVCIGATLATMLGFYAHDVLSYATDPLRVAAQVISGIGFLGVGTILIKGRFQITGLTTAAGLWVTAAIGLALGVGFYEGAIIAFLLSVFTVAFLHKIERFVNAHHTKFGVYIEINSDTAVKDCIAFIREKYSAYDVQVTTPRSGINGNVGVEATFSPESANAKMTDIKADLQELEYVIFAIESL